MFRKMSSGWIMAAAAVAVFVLDHLIPLGYALPMLYVLPILLTWLVSGWQITALVAGSTLVLTWLGTLLSPGVFSSEVFANRAMATALLVIVAGLVVKQKESTQLVATVKKAEHVREEQLRLFIAYAPAAIAMLDRQMCYVATSQRWLTDYGLVRQDLHGHSHYEIFPEIPERWKQVHRRCLAGAVERSEEDLFVRGNGSRQWIRWEIHPWRDASDAVGGIIIFTEDITLQKKAEDTLRTANEILEQRVAERTSDLAKANERFEWIVKATHDGVYDWDLLHDTVYYSPRWKEMHGFQETEFMEPVDGWSARIHPEDRDRVLGRLQDYLARKHPQVWEEYRIQRNDGVCMWVLDRAVALWDEQGRAVRMVGAETDITWLKEAEEALRRRAHEFHALADNVPALFGYVDVDRRYRFVNRRYEEVFGRATTQIVGMSMEDLLSPEGYAVVQPYLDVAFKGEAVSFEYRLPVSGMHEHWFSAQYVPDLDEQGNVAGLFVLKADITPFKVTEAALRQREAQLESLSAQLLQAQEEERRRIAQELHDDFTQRLAALAIDLRTVQLEPSDSDPRGVSRLQQLGDSAERLAADLQQISHRLHPSILEDVGLEAAVKEHADEFSARTGLPTEVIVREVPRNVPLEQAICLYRVLQESLQNVRKYAHATTVLVRLLRTGGGLGLCVLDDGRGFENAQGAEGRRGLGLTSMEERVKRFHGTFRIKTKPGDGTEVHAWVPLDDGKSDG
jgi:PAS domain S-box-containing protein